MNLQENIFRIKQIMGVINEQTYMKSYSPANILDFCGYRAIEMFEETKGLATGGPMRADYFEEKLTSYETLISNNISKTIGMSTFNKFPPKLKMQIWSWMFNNTDASSGTVKWIAGLSQAINFGKFMNLDTKKYDDEKALEYRLKVSNQNSNEYKNAILEIQAFKGDWNTVYTNYLKVLDMQYISTANSNNLQGSYNNSWRYRPGDLDNLYNTCKSSTSQPQTATTGTQTPTPTGGATSTTQTTGDSSNTTTPTPTGGSTQTTSAINDELNDLITSGITDTGVVAPFKEKPYIGTGDTTYNQRKQSSYPINPKLRRPWGDPYIYYSATTGDIYYSLCGKRRDQPKKPVIPCPKLTSDNWIKSDSTNRTNAIKTNIFK